MKYSTAVLVLFIAAVNSQTQEIDEEGDSLYNIEGKVYAPEIDSNENWQEETQIFLNSGKSHYFLNCYRIRTISIFRRG